MRKLAKDLYAPNREMKSVLRNSEFGVSYTFLRKNTRSISKLTTDDFEALIDYTINTDTVLAYQKDGTPHLILMINVVDRDLTRIGIESVTYDPRNKKPNFVKEVAETVATLPVAAVKSEKVEKGEVTVHLPHQKPVVMDNSRFKKEVVSLPEEWKHVAIDCLALVEERHFGATLSELTKLVPSFDALIEYEQCELLQAIDRCSTNYSYADGYSLNNRGTHAMVLVHNSYLKLTGGVYATSSVDVESPMAAQLAKLKDKLVLSPQSAKHIPSNPDSVAEAKPTIPPVVEEPEEQEQPVVVEHEPVVEQTSTAELADDKPRSLLDIQNEMGRVLERIAMEQTQIAIAQMTINSANAAITADTLLLSKLREELVSDRHPSVL